MNKIFKVVWSKAKQCYVVVSEVAKNHSGKKKIVVASVLAALAVGSEMAVVNVQAAVPEGTVSGGAAAAVGASASATASGSTAIGKDVQVTAAYAQALGYQAKVTAQNGVAIGSSGVSGTWTTAGANDSVAIGTAARALSTNGVAIGRFSKVDGSNHSVALGTGSEATAADSTNTTSYLTNETVNNSGNGVIAVGNKHTATDTGTIVRRIVGVASGTEDYDAANIKQLKALEEKTHTRFLAVSGATNKTEADFPNETWTVGKTDAAAGTTASNLVLKGNYNNEAASGERAVAVGPWANGIGARSVALGGRAVSNGMQAVALGQATFAYGENTLAVGSYASVNGDNSLAIGTDTFVGKTTRGANNKGVSETGDKTLFGVAIGFNAKTYGTASVTLGKQAQADSLHSVVLGESSLSKAEDNTNTTAYLTNDAVNNTGNGVVSIGNADANVTRRIINVAGGTNDTDAVNVKQLKALETKSVQKFLSINGAANRTKANYADKTWTIGSPAVTAADGSVTTAATTSTINVMGNYDNEGARGENSVALGPWANGIGPRSVALGSNAIANGNQSIALGQSTFGHGENTLAVGSYATVNGENSIAIGTDTYVGKAERNGAGKAISSTGDKTTFAVAIGFSAKAYGGASTVIGKSAQSDIAHSVVLGEGSRAVEADATNGTAYLTGDTVNNSGNGVVSVGNTSGGSNITRRIVNVAGGTNDTDAVNVKQLKALQANEWLLQTKNASDANATDVTAKTVTGETKKRVVIEAGDNITLENSNGTVKIKANVGVKSITSGNTTALTVSTVDANGAVTITPNIATNLSANGDAGKLVTAGTVNTALAGKVDTNTFNTAVGAKLDKTAERHVKEGSYAVQTDGTVTLTKVDGAGTEKADEAVKITGLATKSAVDALTTKVGTVEGVANQAKATADTAKATADSAATKATAASTKADAASATASDAKTLAGEAKTAAEAAKVGLAGKLDKASELHVKAGTYNIAADGSVTLTKVDGNGTEQDAEKVIINGLASAQSVSDLTTKVNTVEGIANAAKAGLADKADKSTVNELTTKVGTVEATANAAKVGLADKADKATVTELTTKVGEVEATANAAKAGLADKADKATVTELTTKVGEVEATANAAKAGLADKADKATVTELTTKVGTVEATANAAKAGLADKADKATVTELTTKVREVEATANTAKAGLADKADKATVTELTTKVGEVEATANAAKAGLADKADKSTVTELTTKVGEVEATANAAKAGLADKADKATVTELTTKVGEVEATANAAKAGLADKADKATVTELTTKVGEVEATANAAKAGLADKADKATVTELTTKVGEVETTANAAKAGLADKADKATVDALTTEVGKKANAADVQNLTTNKLDKTAERHIKEGTYNLAADGSVTLTKVDGTGAEQDAEKVIIRGLASAQSVSDLTTKVNTVEGIANAAKAGLADKADKSTVTELTTKVGEVEATANAAKVGLADKADKATVTELTTKVGEVEATANAAKAGLADKADKSTVTELTTKVGEVEATANATKATAEQANTTAGEAKTIAEAAKTTAGEAKTAAGEAKTAAEEAKTTAGEAKTKAEEADAKATEAKTAAEEAKTIAGEAKTKAEGADAKATEAKTAAEEAKTIAGEAKTKAEGADAKATEAKTTAGEAKNTADTAKQIADVAKQSADNATAQLKDLSTKVNAGIDKDLKNLSDAGKKVITDLVNVTGDNNIIVKPSVDEKTKVKTFTAKLNDTITLGTGDNAITVNGTNGTITAGTGDNAVTINGENGAVTAKNVKANDGVFGAPADAKGNPTAAGNTTTINNNGLSVVSKDKDGNVSTVTIKDGKISGLTPGKDNNDVATVGQVNDAIAQTAGNIGRALEKTAQRVDQVGAHAAALAAMNPLSYDPLRKSQIMAGIGTYAGNQAVALGVAHYANENFMFNVGFTMGEGKSMANVGATYRFGTGDDDNIPERYKGGPISSMYVMQDEISALKAENARKDVEYGNKIDMLMERIAMLEAKLK